MKPSRLSFRTISYCLLLLLCATPYFNAPLALISGFLFTYFWGNPLSKRSSKMTSILLKVSIVGLGFGINVEQALSVGKEGFGLTLGAIMLTLLLGFWIGKKMKIPKESSYLISCGTAICGGSAIAAVGPIVQASEEKISTSLGVIFLLNSIALLLFPLLGHLLSLSEHQFGLWSAIAIHDTSSVVGAASAYGSEALEVATTVKLARTLWIIPLSFLSILLFKPTDKRIRIPWFILFFLIAMCVHSYLSMGSGVEKVVVSSAKSLLVMTLFLIGSSLTVERLKSVGWRPLLLGVALWVVVSVLSLVVVVELY